MRAKLAWLLPVAVGIGVCALIFMHDDFVVPENFPVLEPHEVGTERTEAPGPDVPVKTEQLATFGSGCFWCTEAVFQQMKGVQKVVSGYSGGEVPNPTYEQICTGTTGHAEVVQVTFDPAIISYPELLEVFWRSHDPTTLNRQGRDFGTQYRSVIFYHSERQRELAERYKQKIDAEGVYRSPIVTEITQYREFFPAEPEHQNFYASNPRRPYCRVVIGPKLDKLRKVFQNRLKEE